MAEQAAAPTYTDAVLTDRSRTWDGWAFCPRARYLRYHSGPSGYGIQRRAVSLPLTTGTYTHDLLAELLLDKAAMGAKVVDGQLGDDARAKLIISKHVGRYKKLCGARGFQEGFAEETDRVIAEQAALIEAFGWCAHYYWLPELFEEYEPVMVEEEINLQPVPESSIIIMLRPDLILRRKLDSSLIQIDFKTVADASYPSWRRQWEDNGQLALQGWGAGEKLGEPVDFAYIYALLKGRRVTPEKEGSKEIQSSPLLYAYLRKANPPMVQEDWALKYEWVDPETGKKRRLGPTYDRTAVYDFPFPGKPVEMSTPEYWVRALSLEDASAQREILGPFQTLPHQKAAILAAVVGEEESWQRKLWAIYDAGEKAGWDEESAEFQAVLNREAPQTWGCHAYGKDCPYLGICKRQAGWQAPLENGYILRKPHHEAEWIQGEARGIVFPVDEGEEE